MKTIRLDGADYEYGSEAHIAKLDSMNQAVVLAVQKDLDKERGRADGLQIKLTKAETDLALATDPKRVDAVVTARVSLETDARKVLGPDVKLDGKTEREIMLAVLKLDAAAVEGKSDDYLRGRFESTCAAGTSIRTDDRSVNHALRVAAGGEPPPVQSSNTNVTKIDATEAHKTMRQRQNARGTEALPGTVAK